MKRLHTALLVASALVAVPAGQAQAQDVQTFEPDSSWALEAGDDYCRLGRDFTNGSDKITLLMERMQPSAQVRLIVIGNAVRLFRGSETVGFRFTPSGSPRMGMRMLQETGDGQQFLTLGQHQIGEFTPPAPGTPPSFTYSREDEAEKAKAVTGIRLEEGLTRPIQINTGSLERPVEALQTCSDDLLAYWGLDYEAHQSLQRPVMPGDGTPPAGGGGGGFPASPSAGWIAQNTVGFQDFARLGAGHNAVRVMVDSTGKATSCHIQQPSLSESTNESICEQVMENAEFQPALDANGNAIDSYWMAPVFSLTPPFGGGRRR